MKPKLLLCLALVLSGGLSGVAQDYICTTNSDSTITINKYTGSGGAVVIPSTINGLQVTDIGHLAFASCGSLTNLTIPNNVTSIEKSAFEMDTNLASVTITDGVAKIGEDAFGYCYRLTNIRIPASVTNIGGFAYGVCWTLTAIIVSTNNPSYSSADGVLFDKSQTRLIEFPAGKAGNYIIPDSVTSIAAGAFQLCTNLTSITMGNGVTNIPVVAFDRCFSLARVNMGNRVASIGEFAFFGCTNLSNIKIPNSIISIGDYAFGGCNRLTNLVIPKNTIKGTHLFEIPINPPD
jgi:hypothetical protein